MATAIAIVPGGLLRQSLVQTPTTTLCNTCTNSKMADEALAFSRGEFTAKRNPKRFKKFRDHALGISKAQGCLPCRQTAGWGDL